MDWVGGEREGKLRGDVRIKRVSPVVDRMHSSRDLEDGESKLSSSPSLLSRVCST